MDWQAECDRWTDHYSIKPVKVSFGIKTLESDNGMEVYGRYLTQFRVILLREGMSIEETYRTLLHEVAHAVVADRCLKGAVQVFAHGVEWMSLCLDLGLEIEARRQGEQTWTELRTYRARPVRKS